MQALRAMKLAWCNDHQGTSRIWQRLDRILVNGAFMASMPSLKVSHLARHISDHCSPLITASLRSTSSKPFRFMKMWTEHDMIVSSLLLLISGYILHLDLLWLFFNPSLRLSELPLNNGTGPLLEMVRKHISQAQDDIIRHESTLQAQWSQHVFDQLYNAKGQLNLWLNREETMLQEKVRIRWLEDGDRNTSFFHASIKERANHASFKLKLMVPYALTSLS